MFVHNLMKCEINSGKFIKVVFSDWSSCAWKILNFFSMYRWIEHINSHCSDHPHWNCLSQAFLPMLFCCEDLAPCNSTGLILDYKPRTYKTHIVQIIPIQIVLVKCSSQSKLPFFFCWMPYIVPFYLLVFWMEVALSKHSFPKAFILCISMSHTRMFSLFLLNCYDISLLTCRFLQKNQSAFFLSTYDSSKGLEETDEEQND